MPDEKKQLRYNIENIWQDGEPNQEKLIESMKILYRLWLEDCDQGSGIRDQGLGKEDKV